jgi:hypothetical protein
MQVFMTDLSPSFDFSPNSLYTMLTKTTYLLTTLVLCLFLNNSLQAQSGKAKREVGLQFSSLNFNGGSFGAFLKKEKKENVYRRVSFASGNIQLNLVEEETQFNFNAGIAIGEERRKQLDEKLLFFQGPEFSLNVGLFTTEDDDATAVTITPGFGWVFGLQHSFNKLWAINIETVPAVAISGNFYGAEISDAEGLSLGIRASSRVNFGIVRKF